MMLVHSEASPQDGWTNHWRPKIIEGNHMDDSFGYEVVIIRISKPSDRWWQRLKIWILTPEPVSISQVLPLEQAFTAAIKFHNTIQLCQQPYRNFEVCVRLYDPSD